MAVDRYVSLDGTNDVDGKYTTWAGAATQIQWAVNFATNGETVWVSSGTYYLTNQIRITNGIILKSYSDNRADTIINGNCPHNINRCFNVNHAGAVVDGFTITNGTTKGTNGISQTNYWLWDMEGGGVKLYAGTLRDCLITGNRETNPAPYAYPADQGGKGGGVWASGSSSIITNCDIIGNESRVAGGGLYLYQGVKMWNCNVISNTCTGSYGGGLHVYSASLGEICSCQVIGNQLTGNYGGGISVNGGNPVTIRNILVRKNTAAAGWHQQFSIQGAYMNADNCTVDGNIDQTWHACTVTIQNSIITGSVYVASDSADKYVILNNDCMASIPASFQRRYITATNCITDNPRFLDQASANYRLQKISPCINTGINKAWMDTSTDLDGLSRIDKFSSRADMGCYEYLPRGIMFKVR
jgi:hypothetical protein